MEAFRSTFRSTTYLVASIIFFSSQVLGCQDSPVGIANSSVIPDDRFTATSSWRNPKNQPWDARLNGTDYGWAPRTTYNPRDYLQIDLGQVFVICAVATQGSSVCTWYTEWTTQYKISSSMDNNTWVMYKNGTTDKLFPGNTDCNTVVKNVLDSPVLVRYLRFIPTRYNQWKTVRLEAYGYLIDHQWTLPPPRVENITSTSACVRWRKPSQANLTSFIIKYETNNNTGVLNVSSSEVSANITDLTPYTNYSVSIIALSTVGHGQYSGSTIFTTASARPYAFPVSVVANSLTSQSVRVTWQASKCGSNGPLRGYKISLAPISVNFTKEYATKAEQTSYDITNLKKWTKYRITVKCYNDNGEGPASADVIVRTMEDAPGQPQRFQITVLNSTAVQLNWALPRERNGIIRGFKLLYEKTGNSSKKDLPGNTTLSYVLSGLDKCTQYSFKMLAYTIKEGPLTPAILEKTAEDAPSAPTILEGNIIKSNGPSVPQVALTWRKPLVCGDNVQHYKVSYNHSEDPIVKKVENVDKSKLTLTIPVWGGATYEFRVRGVTNKKEGPDTPTKTVVIPVYAPSVPPSNSSFAMVNKTTFRVFWDKIPPSKSNGPVLAYEINQTLVRRQIAKRSIDPVVQVKLMNSSCCSLFSYNLLVCAEYQISIRGYTSNGAGPSSGIESLKTSAPDPPTDVKVLSIKKRTILLEWQEPGSETEGKFFYTVFFEGKKAYNDSFSHKGNLSVLSTKKEVRNMYPDTRYTFRVSATTACGKGESSKKTASSITKVDAPPAPFVGLVGNITAEVNNVTMWQSSDINGQIKAYQIIVVKVDETSSFNEAKLKNYEEAEEEKLHYYIGAEIKADDGKTFPRVFILGDEKTYSGYENVKLSKGARYHVLQRALTKDEEGFLAGPGTLIGKGNVPTIQEPPCIGRQSESDTNSSILVVSVTFNVAFLVFIVLLVVYIIKLRKQPEHSKNAEKRPTTAFSQELYSNTNAMISEGSGLPMAPLPPHENSTYEAIDSSGGVDLSQVKTRVTGQHDTPSDKRSTGVYETIDTNSSARANPKPKPKPKPKPEPGQRIYETVQPAEQAENPQERPASSSAQSLTYQSLIQENRARPVYQSLHAYANTKGRFNKDGEYNI